MALVLLRRWSSICRSLESRTSRQALLGPRNRVRTGHHSISTMDQVSKCRTLPQSRWSSRTGQIQRLPSPAQQWQKTGFHYGRRLPRFRCTISIRQSHVSRRVTAAVSFSSPSSSSYQIPMSEPPSPLARFVSGPCNARQSYTCDWCL